jgi:hypothetical protein
MPGENELRAPNTITHNSVTEASVNGEYLSDPQGLEALAYNANALKTNSHQGTVRERIKSIISETCKRHGVSYEQVMSRCRIRSLVDARHEAIAEVKRAYPLMSLLHMGRIFKRDHTTLIFALKKQGVSSDARPLRHAIILREKEEQKRASEARWAEIQRKKIERLRLKEESRARRQQVAVGSINSQTEGAPQHENS